MFFRNIALAACTLLSLLAVSGCNTRDTRPTAETTGKVICEGKPVPHARVFFEPLRSGDNTKPGKQGYGAADAEGNFVITTYNDGDGAVVGRHRVRVDRPHPEDFPDFQCECVTNSEIDIMEVEVKSGEKNTFDVVLKKKTPKEMKAKEVVED